MNPDTNRFETLPADKPAPANFIEFAIGEVVTVKNYDFRIVRVSTNRLHLEPVGAHALCAVNKREHREGRE
jgi:hypothetical protein